LSEAGRQCVKAKLLLAETGTRHADGTISLLRMGITHVWGKALPARFEGVLVVRIEATRIDAGKHEFEVVAMLQDGQEFARRLRGEFEVPKGGGNVNVILRFVTQFPKYDEYTFAALVDKGEQDQITLHVRPDSEKPNVA